MIIYIALNKVDFEASAAFLFEKLRDDFIERNPGFDWEKKQLNFVAPIGFQIRWMLEQAVPKPGRKPVVIPSFDDAFMWGVSEVGEASGAIVGAKADWDRNHPEKHKDDDRTKEISQAILMFLLSLEGGDPMEVINAQLEKWGCPVTEEKYTPMQGLEPYERMRARVEGISEQDYEDRLSKALEYFDDSVRGNS